MRDPARIPRLLAALSRYWALDPDARLCQIVGNAFPERDDTYHAEDEALIERINAMCNRIELLRSATNTVPLTSG